MIERIKCNFGCFLNVHDWWTALDFELGNLNKTSLEFSVHLLVKDLLMFSERDLHFINLLFSSNESVWGKKKKGK